MKTHELKSWPEPFGDTVRGLKTFEYRRDDREFAVGDRLYLREWDPVTVTYSGNHFAVRVIHLLRGPAFGIPEGYVAMSIAVER